MSRSGTSYQFWLPKIISAVALTVSILEAADSRSALTLSSAPLIDFFVQDNENERGLGISVKNNGPGVARVDTIECYVDRKPISQIEEALAASNVKPSALHTVEWENGDSLAVGETVWLFRFEFRTKDP